jgi:hypothetical protein
MIDAPWGVVLVQLDGAVWALATPANTIAAAAKLKSLLPKVAIFSPCEVFL